jgi:hypothetical protein
MTTNQARAVSFAATANTALCLRDVAIAAGYDTNRNNQPAYDFVWRMVGRGWLKATKINKSRYSVEITDAGRAAVA